MLDVIVAGAGPAGSSCAYRLAKAGLNVAVIERAAFPRTKVCGEYLNAGAVGELERIGFDGLRDALPLHGIRMYAHGAAVDLPFYGRAVALPRAVLDERLLDHARNAGVQLIGGRVEDLTRADGMWQLRFRDASGTGVTLQARVVVGADGIGSAVARACGLSRVPRGERRFALGGHYAGFGALDHTIEMYVRGKTYFAINPLDGETANVMVIVGEHELQAWRDDVDARLREAAHDLAGGKRDVGALELRGKRVAVGPLEQRVSAVAQPALYLIGDAAGFLDPFTGQGVCMALRTASAAAEAIVAELRGARDASARYARAHARLMRARRRVAALAGLLARQPVLARFAAAQLGRSAPLRTRLMQAVSGA